MSKQGETRKLIAENRRARFDYHLGDIFEVGIMLLGPEVKSLRAGGSNITDSYASVENGELWLINGLIARYAQAGAWGQVEERRPRKLLARKREIAKLYQAVSREGMTIVQLELYFDAAGRAKLKIALAKGKTKGDKRETAAKRDWSREKARLLKHAA